MSVRANQANQKVQPLDQRQAQVILKWFEAKALSIDKVLKR